MQHDSGYHLLFSNPRLVEDLFRNFVDEPWVKELDFKTLERVNAKMHAEGLERRDGDIIYRINTHQRTEAYLYILMEFQSSPDIWMGIRLMVYVGLLYQHLIKEKKFTPSGKIPPVFPMVLYNGKSRWRAQKEVRNLIDLSRQSSLNIYQPRFRYYVLDESLYADGKPGAVTGVLFKLENCYNSEKLPEILDELASIMNTPKYQGLKRDMLAWLRQSLIPGRHLDIDYEKIDELSELRNMLRERAEEWQKEWLKQGIEQGESKLLNRQLNRRFGDLPSWVTDKLNNASSEEIERWGDNILEAATLEEVFH